MAHQHEHDTSKGFGIGLLLNSGFTIFEFAAGFLSGSLALVADAAHNLTDSLTLAISFIAERISKRQPDAEHTYGHGRVKIIAALLNAGILLAIAGFIGFEAIQRLGSPHEVPGLVVSLVALVGIAVNGGVAYVLSKQKHDLNAKSAYTNMLYDMLSSVGALVAGLAIAIFHTYWLDSVVGVVIAAMLLRATYAIVVEAIHVLLEGVPEGTNMRKVRATLVGIEGVTDVDEVHAWAIDSSYYAFSCHLVTDKTTLKQSCEIVEEAKRLLADDFGFAHATIEVESEDRREHTTHEHE